MAFPDAGWVTNIYDGVPLGQILADERFDYRMLQRTIVAASGVHQTSLSSYEQCRVTPSWKVFVRILAAMDRRAVIHTEPLEPTWITIGNVRTAIEHLVAVIGDRPYRLEDEAAAHVLGRGGRLARLHALVEADPTNLDELAERAMGPFTTVHTQRGGDAPAQIRFKLDGGIAILTVGRKIPPSVKVAYEGLVVHVAPLEEIDLPAA